MSRELPALFDPHAPAISLRPSVPALKRCIALLSGTVSPKGQEPASDEVFEAPDALGWAYQYWQEEEKERVDNQLKTVKGFKCEGYSLIPKTALYTEPYMVKFLVQNSLGATWMGMHPESRLMEGWEYYVKDADRVPSEPKPISEVTFLDPACGSGHFLLEAFDLYYPMYLEEDPSLSPEEVCSSILSRNLYGIDIDERAVQVAQSALWMKAKEYAPDFSLAPIAQKFSSHLIATNIRLPKGKDHLKVFLDKHPEDEPLRTALEAVFEGLENIHELGSLLQIEEPVEKELRYLQKKYKEALSGEGVQQNLLEKTIIQGELPMGVESYEDWKERVISRLKEHFHSEAESADLAQSFFAQSAGKGLALFDLLSRRYDVVATNPPYLGSGNMGEIEKKYIAKRYEPGKRDLYAAFILRNIQLCQEKGRVAMVTQQTWMFLRNFSALRALEEEQLKKVSKDYFKGVLRENSVEALAHLGSNAFEEISGEVVSVALFILSKAIPSQDHKLTAFRLIGPRSPAEKSGLLLKAVSNDISGVSYRILQGRFVEIPQSPLCYWLRDRFFELLKGRTLGAQAAIVQQIITSDNNRFLRYSWETDSLNEEWITYLKAGGYKKWTGLNHMKVSWRNNGITLKQKILEKYSYLGKNAGWLIKESSFYTKGWTYTLMAGGCMSTRCIDHGSICDSVSPVILPQNEATGIGAVLNSYISSYILRALCSEMKFREGYVARLPMPVETSEELRESESACILLKGILCSLNIAEKRFDPYLFSLGDFNEISAILHSVEAFIERVIINEFKLSNMDTKEAHQETGVPAGLYKILCGYDMLPQPSVKLERWEAIEEILKKAIEVLIENSYVEIGGKEIATINKRLKSLYEAGPGVKVEIYGEEAAPDSENDYESVVVGARIPIPPETFLEELSQKLQIHPISVYWMLKEGIEKEGWRCIPEEKRITEDRFTVIVLRLLGYRWPKQIEAGEPVPDWADQDGIIPITRGTGEKTLYERVKERISEEFPGGVVSSIEKEFEEVVGTSLEKWLSGPFYKRHISQFKKRPIAWQVQSQPQSSKGKSKKGISAQPAFSCLVYYHKLDLDFLPKIRTQYVGPLRNSYETELRTLERVAEPTTAQSARKAQLELWIDELSDFDAWLASVSLDGFDCDKLKGIVASEPIDEWTSRDGIAPPPATREALYLQEKRYDPDINDGVRVNIAPLQKAGLLAADVLAKKDLDKAISDRAEWRSDERRWCREKKLPKPGWWMEAEV